MTQSDYLQMLGIWMQIQLSDGLDLWASAGGDHGVTAAQDRALPSLVAPYPTRGGGFTPGPYLHRGVGQRAWYVRGLPPGGVSGEAGQHHPAAQGEVQPQHRSEHHKTI